MHNNVELKICLLNLAYYSTSQTQLCPVITEKQSAEGHSQSTYQQSIASTVNKQSKFDRWHLKQGAVLNKMMKSAFSKGKGFKVYSIFP